MKARHCRPRAVTEHLARSRTQPQRSALSSQLSALSLSLTDTSVSIPDVRRRPTAPPSPPDRRQYEAGRSRAARSPGPAPRALGATLRALATLPRGLGSPPSHTSFTRREDARPGMRRDPYPVLPPSCHRSAWALLPYPTSTLAAPCHGPASPQAPHASDHTQPTPPTLGAGPVRAPDQPLPVAADLALRALCDHVVRRHPSRHPCPPRLHHSKPSPHPTTTTRFPTPSLRSLVPPCDPDQALRDRGQRRDGRVQAQRGLGQAARPLAAAGQLARGAQEAARGAQGAPLRLCQDAGHPSRLLQGVAHVVACSSM